MRQRALILVLLAICFIGLLSSAHAGQRQREDPVRNYHSVYFWNPEAGWVADVRELVLTRDGGRTWTPVLSVYGPPRGLGIIRPISTLNPQVWWFEDSGNLWKTGDQGGTWTVQRLPNIRGVVFVTPDEGWGIQVGGEALSRSQDGGRTWQPVRVAGVDTRRFKIQRLTFLSPQVGWGEVGDGSILQTTDGGRTWTLRGKAQGGFRLFVFADAQTGFAIDLRAPKLYRTRDGGATWDTAQLPPLPDKLSLEGLSVLDPMTAWAVGTRGTILSTADGGATWRQQSSGVQTWLSAVHFSDRQHGWAVGGLNTILKTADGGQTWTKVDDDLKNWRP